MLARRAPGDLGWQTESLFPICRRTYPCRILRESPMCGRWIFKTGANRICPQFSHDIRRRYRRRTHYRERSEGAADAVQVLHLAGRKARQPRPNSQQARQPHRDVVDGVTDGLGVPPFRLPGECEGRERCRAAREEYRDALKLYPNFHPGYFTPTSPKYLLIASGLRSETSSLASIWSGYSRSIANCSPRIT